MFAFLLYLIGIASLTAIIIVLIVYSSEHYHITDVRYWLLVILVIAIMLLGPFGLVRAIEYLT